MTGLVTTIAAYNEQGESECEQLLQAVKAPVEEVKQIFRSAKDIIDTEAQEEVGALQHEFLFWESCLNHVYLEDRDPKFQDAFYTLMEAGAILWTLDPRVANRMDAITQEVVEALSRQTEVIRTAIAGIWQSEEPELKQIEEVFEAISHDGFNPLCRIAEKVMEVANLIVSPDVDNNPIV